MGFIKMHNDIVGTIRNATCLPEPLKTKAVGVFFTLSVLVDRYLSAAYVVNKRHLARVCGGNVAEIGLILGALEELNLLTWARSSRSWVLVLNPYATKTGTGGSRKSLEAAVHVYKEAKTGGSLSESHCKMIKRFIDCESVKQLKNGYFTEKQVTEKDGTGFEGDCLG